MTNYSEGSKKGWITRKSNGNSIPWNKGKTKEEFPQLSNSGVKKGYKHSEEVKRKMREAKVDNIPWNKGKPWSIAMKKKLSKAHSGKHHSEETIRKMREAHLALEYKMPEKNKKKLSKARKGKNGSNWKGGVTPENKRMRKSIEFRFWREGVFARDNYTCQKYGIRGGKLHPHHIKNFAQWPDLRFAIDNGITLSEKAHKKFHKKYGNIKNNERQLSEFLSY